jgi:hypothetical protein
MNITRGNVPNTTKEKKHMIPRNIGFPVRFVIAFSEEELRYSEIPIDKASAITEENPTIVTVEVASSIMLAPAATAKLVITPSTPPIIDAFRYDIFSFQKGIIYFIVCMGIVFQR